MTTGALLIFLLLSLLYSVFAYKMIDMVPERWVLGTLKAADRLVCARMYP